MHQAPPNNSSHLAINQMEIIDQGKAEDIASRYPVEVVWDPDDPRLFVVQASPLSSPPVQKSESASTLKRNQSSAKGYF